MSNKDNAATPNYDATCEICMMTPTVVVNDEDGAHDTGLCGPCCFGEADAIDPENW